VSSSLDFEILRKLDQPAGIGEQVCEVAVDRDGTAELLDRFLGKVGHLQDANGAGLDGQNIAKAGDVVVDGGIVIIFVVDAHRDDDGFDLVWKQTLRLKLRDILQMSSTVRGQGPRQLGSV